MFAEGYGCKQDKEESKKWADRARGRGYQMSGVYCEL
jgi:TPR repeat protein